MPPAELTNKGSMLWHFGAGVLQAADQRFKQFNDSLRFDYRLAEQDIVGSVAGRKRW